MRFSRRVTDLPPYLFADIDRLREETRAKGLRVISLDIGDPDLPTPDFVLELVSKEIRDPQNHRYPAYKGSPYFHKWVVDWFYKRFNVRLDPDAEVITLIGGKEGIAHLPWAVIDPGDLALVPDPGYPVYSSSVKYAGGEVFTFPLIEERGFLPDLSAIPKDVAKLAKIIFVNYPNNPTGACATLEFYKELVAFAEEFGLIILSDLAYSEVYFSESHKPFSLLEIPGAIRRTLEVHSFSKTLNMTGWRIGFAVGAEPLVDALLNIKSNIDSGAFTAIQNACALALHHPKFEEHTRQMRAIMKRRRDSVCNLLRSLDFKFSEPAGAFYVWSHTPRGLSSLEFCADLLGSTGVSLTPGVGYGKIGEGFFRLALTVPDKDLEDATTQIMRWIKMRHKY